MSIDVRTEKERYYTRRNYEILLERLIFFFFPSMLTGERTSFARLTLNFVLKGLCACVRFYIEIRLYDLCRLSLYNLQR